MNNQAMKPINIKAFERDIHLLLESHEIIGERTEVIIEAQRFPDSPHLGTTISLKFQEPDGQDLVDRFYMSKSIEKVQMHNDEIPITAPNMRLLNDDLNNVLVRHGVFKGKKNLTIEQTENHQQRFGTLVLHEIKLMYYAPSEFGIDDPATRPKFAKKPEKAVKSHNTRVEVRPRRTVGSQRANLLSEFKQSLKRFDDSVSRLNKMLQDDKDEE